MAWTMEEVGKWEGDHVGIDAEGGPSAGLDALEVALAERRFGAEREGVAREYQRIKRYQVEEIRQLEREIRDDEAAVREAKAQIVEKEVKAAELALGVLGVRASQSQADSAQKALGVSWLALFVALAGIALTASTLATRSN